MATRREFLRGAGAAAIATQVPLAPAAASLPATPFAVSSIPAAGTWFGPAAGLVLFSMWRIVQSELRNDAHCRLQSTRVDLLSILRARAEAGS